MHLFRQKDLVGPPYPSPHSLRFPLRRFTPIPPRSNSTNPRVTIVSFSPFLGSNRRMRNRSSRHPFPPADVRCGTRPCVETGRPVVGRVSHDFTTSEFGIRDDEPVKLPLEKIVSNQRSYLQTFVTTMDDCFAASNGYIILRRF